MLPTDNRPIFPSSHDLIDRSPRKFLLPLAETAQWGLMELPGMLYRRTIYFPVERRDPVPGVIGRVGFTL